MTEATAFVITHESDPRRTSKSTNFIALEISRSLGRRGVPVVRIHPNRLDHGLASRYCRGVEVSPDAYASESRLLDFLLSLEARYPGQRVLIPASDDCAEFAAKYRESLRGVFSVVGPGWQVMQGIRDKRRQYEAAQRLGMAIPETHFPVSVDQVRSLARELSHYPYIIKPLVAHTWRLASMQAVSKGKKAFLARDPGELVALYETVAAGDANLMIQEVIGGSDDQLFTFIGYFDRHSQALGYCIRKKLRQCPLDFGYCTATVSCSEPVVEEQSLRLLSAIGYHGIAGVEWKHDRETGTFKLIEINGRAMNTIALARACGVDIPAIAFADAIQRPQAPIKSWRDGVKWQWCTQDLWAARELYRRGDIGLWDLQRALAGADVHAVYAKDDWRPFLGYFADFLGSLAAPRPSSAGRDRRATSIQGAA